MVRVLFTDTHFGVKQNSITWLESQMAFIDNELIPWLKLNKDNEIRLIHLGDVFETRSSISTMIARRVREKFLELRSLVKEFYIVAGNHDFYSPDRADIETLSLVFKDCDIHLVIDEIVVADEDMFVPWYKFKEPYNVRKLLRQNPNVKNIYTHADIFGEDKTSLKAKVFSGHIHIPQIKAEAGLYNLGSCYSLNFADANNPRCWYIYDGQMLIPRENESSIRFWRLYNEEIFDIKGTPQDYYELYVDQANMQKEEYTSRISELTKQLKNIWVIPIIKAYESDGEQLASYNIEEICQSMIPQHLTKKFKIIKESIK